MSRDKEYKKYVHAKYFKQNYGINESSIIEYSKDEFVRYKKMYFGTRLYHMDDASILIKMRELENISLENIFNLLRNTIRKVSE